MPGHAVLRRCARAGRRAPEEAAEANARVELGRKPRAERIGFVAHEIRYQAIVTQLTRVKAQGVRVVQHDHRLESDDRRELTSPAETRNALVYATGWRERSGGAMRIHGDAHEKTPHPRALS